MGKIKIFKNVAWTVTATTFAIPFAITSCNKTNQSLNSIRIDLPQESFSVACGKTFKSSSPIDVICLNNQGKTIDAQTSFVITNDNNKSSQWIWVDKNNKINIKADINPGNYQFNIFAQSIDQTIKSKTKHFFVSIYKEQITPDKISIVYPQEQQLVFYGQDGSINLDILPSKPGYEEYELNKECNWEITNQSELPLDLNNQPVFKINKQKTNVKLLVSKNIDKSYSKEYEIAIKASCVNDENVTDNCIINIKIEDGYYFEQDGWIYTRKELDGDWELTRINSEEVILDTVLDNIYGYPVTKIGDYFCNNSGIKNMSVVTLPSHIKTIGRFAFYNQSLLTTLAIPGVTVVEECAFYGCNNIADIAEENQPDLYYVGDFGFFRCNKIKLTKLKNLRFLGDHAFEEVKMENIELGSDIKFMGYRCIGQNEKLVNITIDAVVPPELVGSLWGGSIVMKPTITVPANSLEIYRNTMCWKNFSTLFIGK